MNSGREQFILETAQSFTGRGLPLAELVEIGEKTYYDIIANFDIKNVNKRFPNNIDRMLDVYIRVGVGLAMEDAVINIKYEARKREDAAYRAKITGDLNTDIDLLVNEDYMTKNKLRRIRERKGYTLQDAADGTGQHIGVIADGENRLLPQTHVEIVAALGNFYDVDVDWLLGLRKFHGEYGGVNADKDICFDVLSQAAVTYDTSLDNLQGVLDIPPETFKRSHWEDGISLGNFVKISQIGGVPCTEMLK